MENLKAKYQQLVAGRKDIIKQINDLGNDEIVKKYLALCNQDNSLSIQQKNLYSQMKTEEYSLCDHIWVNILQYYDHSEGRFYHYHGCIKCGLDQSVFLLMENTNDPKWLTPDQRIMYDFMRYHSYNSDVNTHLFCDLNLAKAIYSKLKEVHPNIDDETAVKYLSVALHNIRDTRVSDERKVSRAKRLSLNPNFNKWN